MRYNKHRLAVKKSKTLPITFVKQDMTSFSGLVFVGHILRLYQLHRRLKQKLATFDFSGDYHIGDVLFLTILALILGMDRLSHLEYLREDPLFQRISQLNRIPHRTTVARALKQFSSDSLKALIELNGQLVTEHIQRLGLSTLTLDLDGTVLSTKGNPAWAFKGYNPIKKGAKSYFPLTVHVAETGHFLNIVNRPGNIHDSQRALSVVRNVAGQLAGYDLRFRADSAFCTPDLLDYLLARGFGFAIKAPFWKLKSLKEGIRQRKRWFKLDKTWSYYWAQDCIEKADYHHDVLVLRKKVNKTRGHQLDLFSPNNGVYEYSAIVTDSKDWNPQELLAFMSGRSAQENSISELKGDFAFDSIPTNHYAANSTYLQLSQMAYNVSLSIQHDLGLASKRKDNQKATRLFQTWKMKTFRWLVLNRAGKITRRNGYKVLALSKNPAAESLYASIENTISHLDSDSFAQAA